MVAERAPLAFPTGDERRSGHLRLRHLRLRASPASVRHLRHQRLRASPAPARREGEGEEAHGEGDGLPSSPVEKAEEDGDAAPSGGSPESCARTPSSLDRSMSPPPPLLWGRLEEEWGLCPGRLHEPAFIPPPFSPGSSQEPALKVTFCPGCNYQPVLKIYL